MHYTLRNIWEVLVEFYQYTNANAAVWLAELLVYCKPLEYSGCRSSTKCDVFYSFSEVLEGILDVNG